MLGSRTVVRAPGRTIPKKGERGCVRPRACLCVTSPSCSSSADWSLAEIRSRPHLTRVLLVLLMAFVGAGAARLAPSYGADLRIEDA
jgi:hypothetical protein